MAVSHATVREIAMYIETAFATVAGGPADWSTNGTYFYATDIDISGLAQANVDNENNLIQSARSTHDKIRTLRSESKFTFGTYLHGKTTNAAEAAAATTYHLAEILQAALGAKDLGYGIGFAATGTAAAPDVDADPGFAVGDWIWAYDNSTAIGHFYQITALPGGVTLTLDRTLHFTPEAADRAYSVIDCHINPRSTTRRDHSQHKTMAFLVQGEDSEDVWVARGCKPALSIEPIEAGVPLKMMFEVSTATHEVEGSTWEDFSAASVVGEAGNVTAISDNTWVYMENAGTALATTAITFYGGITIAPGVAWEPSKGPNGIEGVHGWVDSLGPTTVELTVPFDNAYHTAYRAQTRKHLLIEVGDTVTSKPVGFYFPSLEFAAEPKRSDEGALTSSTLSFVAHPTTGTFASDDFIKARSPFHVLLVA